VGINIMLFVFGAFMFLPMVYAISQSLKPLDELWMFPPRFFVINPTLKNFSELFRLMSESWVPFSRYIFNTAFVSVGGTFGHLFLASMAAYAMTKINFPGRKGMFMLVYYSLMFHSTVSALSNFIIMSFLGWIDTYWSLIIPSFGYTLGFYLMRQFMESTVPDSVLESARLDGAKEISIYWNIVMPMVKPAWLTLIVYSFQGLWNAGASTFIYSEQLKTLNYAISQITAGGIARSGASAAAAVLLMIPPIVAFVINQSKMLQTMAHSGIKD
jgi:ABC-type glycerol-3-phosphate transport system permease component